MPSAALTVRQAEVLTMIERFIAANRYSPSYDEISDAVGLTSLATVAKHVSNLERKGYIKKQYNRSRCIEVVPDETHVTCPTCGTEIFL